MLWQPSTGALLTNNLSGAKPGEESAACIALSKNDSYVMSASGGKVSLFNMMTFKVSSYPSTRITETSSIFPDGGCSRLLMALRLLL